MPTIARWQQRLGLADYRLSVERISQFQVCDEICRVGNSLVGVGADHTRREAVIFHTRRLSEEDIVHELLHLRHPDWSEAQVCKQTAALLNGQATAPESKETSNGHPVLRRQIAAEGQCA